MRLALAAMLVLLPQDQRVPSPAVPKEKETELRKVYAKELASRDAEAIQKLLQDGLETKDDPAAQFQLLQFAYQKAIDLFEFPAAFRIADELARRYSDLDGVGLRSRALEDARRKKPKGEQLDQLTQADIDFALHEMEMGRQNSLHFDEAARAAKNAAAGARAMKSRFLEDKAEAISRYAADLSKDKSDDFAAARFRYFVLGESTEDVLKALSNGPDAKLKKLAGLQGIAAKAAGTFTEFGDVAYEAAIESSRLAFERLRLLAEARGFYDRAVAEATGAEKTRYERDDKLKKRKAEIDAKLGQASPAPSNGLVGFWSFNEGAGPAVRDQSPRANHGTVSGAKWESGIAGAALGFNGKDSSVSLGVSGVPEIHGRKSILFWFRIEIPPGASTGEAQAVVSLTADGVGATIGFWQGKVMVWSEGGGRLGAAPLPTVSKWHHLAYTFDGTAGRLYIDGALQDTCREKPQSGPCKKLQFGSMGTIQFFNGLLDEVRIYNRTLSESEIQSVCKFRS
jgi:hypothetical protein